MASTIPPPHIPFASGSSYLPDALVPMPLPFHFLFPGLVLIRRSFPFVFGVLCAPVWIFRLSAFHSPPPKVGPLRAPTASFFYLHLPQRCSSQIAPKPSPYFLVLLFSVCFVCFFLFLQFCRSSPRLFRHTPSTARPFFRASNASFSVRGAPTRRASNDVLQSRNTGSTCT
jgi:hypothetical protein